MTLDRRSAAMFVAGWCNFLNFYSPQPILPAMAEELGASPTQIGLTLTVTLLAVALLAPVAGAISDRMGRKRVVVCAMLALVLPTILVAESASLFQLLLWRSVQGMIMPFIFTVTVAYIGDECSGAETIRVSGLYASGAIFGGFSGRFVAGLVSDLADWHAAFLLLGVLTAAAALFVAWAMPPERRFTPVRGGIMSTLSAYGQHLRNPRLLGTCLVGLGMLFSLVATFTFINFILTEPPFSLSAAQMGTLFAVYLTGMVTTPIATRFAARAGRRRTIAIALPVASAGLLLTLVPSLPVITIGLALMLGGLFTSQALATGFIGVAARQARSSAVGLYVTIYYAGGALGGILPGWFWHHHGWPGVVGLILAVIATMFTAAMLCWRKPA